MIAPAETPPNRLTILLAFLAMAGYIAIGYTASQGLAENIAIGASLLGGAVLLAFLSPVAGVSAAVVAAPTMFDLYPMPAGTFSLLELAILTSFAGIAFRMTVDGFRRGFSPLRDILSPAQVTVPAVLFVVAAAVTMISLADPGHRAESLRELRTVIIEPLMLLAVARMTLRDRDSRVMTGSALVIGGTAIATYAVAQIVLDLGGVQAGDITRATATYTHPNNLALYLERTLLFTLGMGFVRPRWWPVWALAAVQFVGLILTFSRGALIALVAGLALMLLLRGLYKWLMLLIAGGVGVAVSGAVLFPERFIDAGGSGAEPTRFTIWRASVRMALDHPFFGVGPDQFLYQYSRRYIEPMGWPERYTSHPHNLLLDTWLRLGVPGLAAGATLAAGLAWWIGKRVASVRDDALAMGALAALAGGVAHGMVDNGFFLPDLATLTWYFVALLITVPVLRTDQNPGIEEEPAKRHAMEATWPVPVRTSRALTRGEPEVRRNWSTLSMTVMAVLFVSAPFLTSSPYLPYLLIALVGLVTILDPAVGLAAVALSVPLQEAFLVPFVTGDLTYTQITVFGLVLGWGVSFYRYRIWLDSIVLGFLAVFMAFSISLVEMDSPGLWFGEVYRWAAAATVYVIARSVLSRWEQVRTVLYGIALAVMGTALHQVVEIADFLRSPEALPLGSYRAMGAFNVPNPLAAYIEFTVPPLLVLALMGLRHGLRDRMGTPFWIVAGVASGLGLLTLGLTQSRGGLIGIAGALIVVFLVLPRRIQVMTLAATALLTGAVLVTPVGETAIERFESALVENPSPIRTEHGGFWGRESLWRAGLDMLQDEPLTGIGAGEYDYHYREYVAEWIDRFPRGQAHNGWLQLGAQAGIPGIVAFTAWLTASILAVLGAARRATDEIGRLLAWGALAVMVAFTVHSLVDYLNVLSLGLQLSIVVAIGQALAPEPLPSLQRRPQVIDNIRPAEAGL